MTAYIRSKKIKKTNLYKRSRAISSFILVISIIFLGMAYLIQANGLVGSSYRIRQLKKSVDQLQTRSKDLETKIAFCQSPVNLEKMVQPLNLVETNEVIYLEKEQSVAVK